MCNWRFWEDKMFKLISSSLHFVQRSGVLSNELKGTVWKDIMPGKFQSIFALHRKGQECIRAMHTTLPRRKEDRREMMASLPPKDEGTQGEETVNIDFISSQEDVFPDETTPTRLFNGIPFCELPVCNIKASKNNTIISLTEYTGAIKLLRSCGIEGFKNTRKGTNIAAQATAISFSTIALENGYKTVRVRVRGLGPGRLSAIKGLQMGGMDIVSITDSTPVSWNPPRPRKRRKL